MATHSYKNHEIEVSTRDNGDFIEAIAKFKPMHGYLGTFSMQGKFSSLEAAEQTVLEEAKRIIDNRSKQAIGAFFKRFQLRASLQLVRWPVFVARSLATRFAEQDETLSVEAKRLKRLRMLLKAALNRRALNTPHSKTVLDRVIASTR